MDYHHSTQSKVTVETVPVQDFYSDSAHFEKSERSLFQQNVLDGYQNKDISTEYAQTLILRETQKVFDFFSQTLNHSVKTQSCYNLGFGGEYLDISESFFKPVIYKVTVGSY